MQGDAISFDSFVIPRTKPRTTKKRIKIKNARWNVHAKRMSTINNLQSIPIAKLLYLYNLFVHLIASTCGPTFLYKSKWHIKDVKLYHTIRSFSAKEKRRFGPVAHCLHLILQVTYTINICLYIYIHYTRTRESLRRSRNRSVFISLSLPLMFW